MIKNIYYPPSLMYSQILWQRPHHFMHGLGKLGYRIFWVDKYSEKGEVKNVGDNVLLIKNIDTARKMLNNEEVIMYAQYYQAFEFMDGFNIKKIWYDHLDDVPGREKASLECMKKSDFVTASADILLSQALECNKKSYLVRNGVPYDFFEHAQKEMSCPQMENLKRYHSNKKIAVYSGHIGECFDMDLFENTIRMMPDVVFVFLGLSGGQHRERINRMPMKYPNFHAFGKIDYPLLPNYLSHADVCLVCFDGSAYAAAVNPIKVHEYHAAGKPVVSTAINEMQKYGDIVYLSKCGDVNLYVNNIRRALTGDDKFHARIESAKQHDWKHAISKIDKLIREEF